MATCYLVDYENVQDSGLIGIDSLNRDDCVFIFYTVYANTVRLDVLEGIQAGLRVIHVPEGSQSLDRHLISFLGFLIGQTDDPEARFQVISKDNGYRRIIEFWNRWFKMDDKVCQRASISGQNVVSESAPCFTPDGKVLTENGRQLRHAIIQHIRNHGEITRKGQCYMMVSALCTYLNTLDVYREEREVSGKKPMNFLKSELGDILVIHREQKTHFAYLVSDDKYGDSPSDRTTVESDPEPSEAIPVEAEHSDIEERVEPIEAIVRAAFENDGENDDTGNRRVKASLLRDRLEKLDGYRLARSESGKKPLVYMAEALEHLVLIRVIKSRPWAYLLEDEAPAPELPQSSPEEVTMLSVSEPSVSDHSTSSEEEIQPSEVEIDDMGLSLRTSNSLKRAGFHTADEFIDKSDEELLKIRYLGQKAVGEIRNWIRVQSEICSFHRNALISSSDLTS